MVGAVVDQMIYEEYAATQIKRLVFAGMVL